MVYNTRITMTAYARRHVLVFSNTKKIPIISHNWLRNSGSHFFYQKALLNRRSLFKSSIAVTSLTWAWWRLNSQAIRLFVPQLIQTNNTENIKALHYSGPCVKGIHWSPMDSPHKGPVMLKVAMLWRYRTHSFGVSRKNDHDQTLTRHDLTPSTWSMSRLLQLGSDIYFGVSSEPWTQENPDSLLWFIVSFEFAFLDRSDHQMTWLCAGNIVTVTGL